MNGASAQVHPCSLQRRSVRGLDQAAAAATRWVFEDVLPLWANTGHDAAHGGFFEQIALDGKAITLPKRCRVQARQSYVFVEAGRLGWAGPWRERAHSGVSFMLNYHARPDGFMRFTTHMDGSPCDERVDNYDQAFAVFALAHAYSVAPARYRQVAQMVLAALRRERMHPLGGFYEAAPCDDLLLANPHMHLFEAALAWLDIDPQPVWRELAQEIADLCVFRFIDPADRRCSSISGRIGRRKREREDGSSNRATSSNGLGSWRDGASMAVPLMFPSFAAFMKLRIAMASIARGAWRLANCGSRVVSRTPACECGRRPSE